MNPILLGLPAVLLLVGIVLAARARARRHRRLWNDRPDSVAAIATRVAAEREQPQPVWPAYDRDLRHEGGQERDQPTLRLPRIRSPQAKSPRTIPRTRPYLRASPAPPENVSGTAVPNPDPRAES